MPLPHLALLLSTFCILQTACAFFSNAREENLREVRVGQTKAEVLSTLGEPSQRVVNRAVERWLYDITSADERQTYPYTGVFEGGKMTAWYFDTARLSKNTGHTPKRARGKSHVVVPPPGT